MCGYSWTQKYNRIPIKCPSCHSTLWNREDNRHFNPPPPKPLIKVSHELIIKERKAIPCATLQQMSDKFGVSRERIRQILKYENLPTRHYTKHLNCAKCGTRILLNNKSGYCHKCLVEIHRIPLICDECGRLYYRSECQVIHTAKNKQYRGGQFCSNRCRNIHRWRIIGLRNSRHSKQYIIVRWLTRLGFTPKDVHHYYPAINMRQIYYANMHYSHADYGSAVLPKLINK